MEPSDFGRRIGASEAHDYIEKYKTHRHTLVDEILPLVPPDAAQDVKDSATFHKSKVNAFIFDAALIRSILDVPDPAPYFAVFLGANGVAPNVVVMGLVDGPETNSLVVRPAGDDGEHPGLVVDAKYPGLGNGPMYIIQN